MTMMRTWSMVLVVLTLSTPLFAQQSYREFERGLNLSDSQRARVDGIRRKYIDEWRALKADSMKKRMELRELNRERPDQRERTGRLQGELDRIEAAKERLFRQYSGEVSGVFNDEQRGRFNEFRDRERRRPMNPPHYRMHGR